MKSIFFNLSFIFFILFSVNLLISKEISEFKKAFINNQNGIVLFKNKSEKKEQILKIKYGEEIELVIEEKDPDWIKVKKGNMLGFIPNSEISLKDFIVFTKPKSIQFAVVKQEKISSFRKPFLDLGTTIEYPQFTILKVKSVNTVEKKSINKSWIEIETEDLKTGFVLGDLELCDSKEVAEEIKNKKQLNLNGFALVDQPMYFANPGVPFKEKKVDLVGFSKKGEFLLVSMSLEWNGVKYYKVSMQNPATYYKMQATPKDFNDSPFIAWIEEKNIKYFTPKEFSLYTLENSEYKNKALLKAISETNEDKPLNFKNIQVKPLLLEGKKKSTGFILVGLEEGYTNGFRYGYINRVNYLVQEKSEKYKVFVGNIQNRGRIEMYDLDEDGIPEFYTHMEMESFSRVAFTTPLFYGYIDGVYKEIPLPGNFLAKYTIVDNFLYLNETDNSTSKRVKLKYKYNKGKFIKVK